MPSVTSCFSGYWCLQGLDIITSTAFLIRMLSYTYLLSPQCLTSCKFGVAAASVSERKYDWQMMTKRLAELFSKLGLSAGNPNCLHAFWCRKTTKQQFTHPTNRSTQSVPIKFLGHRLDNKKSYLIIEHCEFSNFIEL